jgi:rubredoxin
MRLEGQSKLGYYPTPPLTLNLLLTWLSAPDGGLRRYLDPCAGKGEALGAVAAAHGPAETYGIELSDVRAVEARDALTHVINAGYEYAVLTDETFSLVLLNPPYDGENITGSGARMEETFLINTTSRLVPDGVLIYLIPHARMNEKITRHLAGWYRDLRCFRMPADEYAVFKQIIVFGQRRADYQAPSGDALRAVQAWADAGLITGYAEVEALDPDTGKTKKTRQPVLAELPYLGAGAGEYAIPVSPLKGKHGASFRFQYMVVSDDDMLREAEDAAGRLLASREWRDLVTPTAPKTITPAMTPKKGHIGPQMLSGLLGTNLVTSPADRQPVALKGHIHKRRFVVQGDALELLDDDMPADDKKSRLRRVEIKEKFEAVMMTLGADGTLTEHRDPAEIGRLLEQHVRELAEIVQVRNVPRYDLKPDAWEWAVFDPLSRERKLPGRNETGLTDFQRHLAIALGRLCLATGAGLANAEMGSGKSTILLGVAEYLRHVQVAQSGRAKRSPYPALIVGPGIVTGQENWPKEIREVIPGAESRVINVGVKPAPKPVRIGQWLSALGLRVEHEAPFELDAELAEEHYKAYRGALPDWVRALDARLRRAGISSSAIIKARLVDAAVVAEAMATVRSLAREQNVELAPSVQAALAQSFGYAVRKPPRLRKGAQRSNLLDGRVGGSYAWLGLEVPRDEADARELAGEYSLDQFAREYTNGALPEKTYAILSFETAKLGAGRVPAMAHRTIRVERTDDESGETWTELATVCACPHCGAIASDKYDLQTGEPLRPIEALVAEKWVGSRRRFCKAPLMYFNPRTARHEPGRWVYDAEKGREVVRTHDADGNPYLCGRPLFQDTALRREAAARYALKKLKGFFGLLAVDEIHKCKAKGTGVGWVLQALNKASRYTVGLTGTLMGGYSTSIFWLLYRLSPDVRREFGFNDEQRWTEKYGLFKSVFYVSPDDDVAEDGTYTGTKHFETVSEMPGISPATVGLGLEYTTFSSLKDIGLPLPAYSEQIVRLPLTGAMQAQILEADGSQSKPPDGLLAWALEQQKRDDGRGAISVWLNTALNRPDAMFRFEKVWFNRRISGRGKYAVRRKELVAEFNPVGHANEDKEMPITELLPKELWLARTCRVEAQRGRKVLVYVRQTGERDIQPRLADILRDHGLRPAILRPSLAPAKRATWIKQNAEKMDVLLTNARLVEVGLNLSMVNTGIFYECEWSLYTLWQALRRLYRPGASMPVHMYFPVYEGTLEEGAINLLGAKMKAAQIFFGDEVGGALIEDEDDSDMLHGLLRQALGQVEVGRAEGLFSLGNDQTVTDSPIGSPTAISPHLVTMMDLWGQRQSIIRQTRRRNGGRRQSEGQLAMF